MLKTREALANQTELHSSSVEVAGNVIDQIGLIRSQDAVFAEKSKFLTGARDTPLKIMLGCDVPGAGKRDDVVAHDSTSVSRWYWASQTRSTSRAKDFRKGHFLVNKLDANLFRLLHHEARHACQRPHFDGHRIGGSVHLLDQLPQREAGLAHVLVADDPAVAGKDAVAGMVRDEARLCGSLAAAVSYRGRNDIGVFLALAAGLPWRKAITLCPLDWQVYGPRGPISAWVPWPDATLIWTRVTPSSQYTSRTTLIAPVFRMM